MGMSEAAKKKRAAYMKEYRQNNKEHIREYNTRWQRENKDKVKASQVRYWEKRAKESKKEATS